MSSGNVNRIASADDFWRYVWDALAEYGACDTWGSVEQERVTAAWVAAGRPVGIAEWIIAHSNEGPPYAPRSNGMG